MENNVLDKLKEDLEKAKGLAEKYNLLAEGVLCTDGRYRQYVLMEAMQNAKVKYIKHLIEFIAEG